MMYDTTIRMNQEETIDESDEKKLLLTPQWPNHRQKHIINLKDLWKKLKNIS